MTFEEIKQAVITAEKDESFRKSLEAVQSQEEVMDVLKSYHIIETEEDYELFDKMMSAATGELPDDILENVAGGFAWSDLINIPKWVNDTWKEIKRGITSSFKAGRKTGKWLNDNNLD